MKTKKITAIAMAAVMSLSMVATTAMSASAEELDTPVQEEGLAEDVTVTGTTINWGSRTVSTETNVVSYALTNVVLYKTDYSDVSMSNDAVSLATISFDGTNYTITVYFQPVTRSVTVGSLTLVDATAVVTGVDASGYNNTSLNISFTSDSAGYSSAEITIPANTSIDSIPAFSYTSNGTTCNVDPEYGITLDFETSFDKSYLNRIPAMTHPSAEMTFSVGTTPLS